MELDILNATVIFGRGGEKSSQPAIRMTVVPAPYSDSILLGETHLFSQHVMRGDRKRVNATLWISSSLDHQNFAIEHIDGNLIRSTGLAGYVRAFFPTDQDANAGLRFVLFAEELQMAEMLRQLETSSPGKARIDLIVDGMKTSIIPDEDHWPKPEEKSWSVLPISDYSLNFEKIATTRQEIREISDEQLRQEDLDADDLELVKSATRRIEESELFRNDPTREILKQVRALLLLISMLLVGLAFTFAI